MLVAGTKIMQTQSEMLRPVEPTDPILSQIAEEVKFEEILSPHVQGIVNRMLELAAGKGHDKEDSRQMLGLAAPQIGAGKRIITIDMTADGFNKEQTLRVFINPRISHRSKETVPGREGCWSCGNICGNVERAKIVTLEGFDQNGKSVAVELVGFVARIAQHETDHLDGVRFPDRIPVTEPERLHWVEHDEFEEYRTKWEHWPNICPRKQWEALKAGSAR
jgi:peptide deformylase